MLKTLPPYKDKPKITDVWLSGAQSLPKPYPAGHRLSRDLVLKADKVVSKFPGYEFTPIVSLDKVAKALGVGDILYKDESHRLGLKNFKALGGAYAVLDLVEKAGKNITITSSTAGSHGRSIAWGAKMAGIKCVIYIGEGVSQGRQKAMEGLGARVIRVPGLYEESFQAAREAAKQDGWYMVCDTTFEDYEDIPYTIMQGYGVLAEEINKQVTGGIEGLTHVFLQAGCGGFAAAIMAAMINLCGNFRPRFILVEPDKAACVLESLKAAKPIYLDGDIKTLMGGLEVAEVSMAAWPVFLDYCDAVISISDESVQPAMQALARGDWGDTPIEAGESAPAGLIGAIAAALDPGLRRTLGLDENSRILTIGTEGAADPETYEVLTGVKPFVRGLS